MSNSFVCTKDVFKYIYRLEKRRSSRQKHYSYLSYIKLEEINNNKIKKAKQSIEVILRNKLRSGDVVCKWNDNHFVLILNNVDNNSISIVMERIRNRFFKSINDSSIDLTINYSPII